MDNKKRKMNELNQCCICSEWTLGCTNVYNISLREENLMHAFVDVIYFVLEIDIAPGFSDICNKCKHRIIEYYHFKKRSQSKKSSGLVQEIIKIVHGYIVRNEIKAITIEESHDKLVIMQKTQQQNEITMPQNDNFDYADYAAAEIKREDDNEVEGQYRKDTVDEVTIKHELDMNFEEDCYEAPANLDPGPIPELNAIPTSDLSYLDLILKINQEILRKVNGIDTKFDTQMNFNVPN